jgi:hypothetical protein
MKRPDRQTVLRIILIALTVWLFPAYALVTTMVVGEFVASGFDPARLLVLDGPMLGPALAGLIVGPPCWLVAFGIWALLHRLGKTGLVAGGLTGAAIALGPIGLIVLLDRPSVSTEPRIIEILRAAIHNAGNIAALLVIGVLTGLLVWRIAYSSAIRSSASTADAIS